MSIKLKLVILFILIKVLPLLLITYVSIEGILKLNSYFVNNVETLYSKNEEVIKNTAYKSINDSIEALDLKSQNNIERLTVDIANEVATFLYERDKDILFLSTLNLTQNIIDNFFNSKQKEITLTPEYYYNDEIKKWIPKNKVEPQIFYTRSDLADNQKNFRYSSTKKTIQERIPIYKEVSFFDLEGIEIYKKSLINEDKLDISKIENTYIKAEKYFDAVSKLKRGEIYVSDVIGEYLPSKIIGEFTKEKAEELGINFKPENHAYAGAENPVGKKYTGIIRFITPVFNNEEKIGYISLALDHRHIMEYTDTLNPIAVEYFEISDASQGNYAFMWDYEGRNISHPRDYFITGFNKNTGNRVAGWVSSSINEEFKQSTHKELSSFLKNYPKFQNQSLKEKPNLEQLKQKGEVGLDCRYLNFAPQCQGWMQLTEDGGYGSFVIFWSNVWKLTTAATIPYYTGQYKNSKRGFGFVTIGANVDEFHSAANKTKKDIENVIKQETNSMHSLLKNNEESMYIIIKKLIEELSVYTFIMILFVLIIAFWLSNYISTKIMNLIIGTKEFSNNNLNYRIKVSSQDEVGQLEKSFNTMAQQIKENNKQINEQYDLMAQQSKMAAMGEMLENIAHQWRQPLSIISSLATSIQLRNEIDSYNKDELNKDMSKITASVQYLTNTINDFRSFFEPNRPKESFEINSLMLKTIKLIEPNIKKQNLTIIKNIENSLIDGFENELVHVLMNIINNANDAFKSDNKDKLVLINGYIKNNNYILEIRDNAGGIPKEFLSRVFEPYFTTKHKAQGTGIGLYMSKIMIEKHMEGKINVVNDDFSYNGKKYYGALFTINFKI